MKKDKISGKTLDNVIKRALYLATQMIWQANHRPDKEKGDPKVGGHPAASSSSLHILAALHLFVKSGYDFFANKPHASPSDHSLNYLLDLLLDKDGQPLPLEKKNQAMMGLRAFPKNGEEVFQSYHSVYDSDHHGFLPSGTVGIPPVNVGYLALAYRFAKNHGFDVPEAHFWALVGDSEFREGSLFEAIPDFAERELGNVTWILDYNRQSLDGHRMGNREIMNGTDAQRVERTMLANGWEVIQLQHGKKRQELFKMKGGDTFKNFLENELEDYELQALLNIKDAKSLKEEMSSKHASIKAFVKDISAEELFTALRDFGGHDIEMVIEALEKSKLNKRKPTMVIAHTLKGWGLEMAANQGNHSSLPEQKEVDQLQSKQGLKPEVLFAPFDAKSDEGQFLKLRGQALLKDIQDMKALKKRNEEKYLKQLTEHGETPTSLGINLKMASYPHTQWMLGQLTAKLTRIANTPLDEKKLVEKQKPLTDEEKTWKFTAESFVSMAPDVGTSTNLNPAMDGKIFQANQVEAFEDEFEVRDTTLPNLVPGQEVSDRFLRFEIAEANVMSCVGSFGKLKEFIGVPLMPLMTVYDFFVKRAHDQYFYNLYWGSSFIAVGTPSGITLSPEGAQHGWKSDFQIPNQITWEPFFCQELDWILVDAMKRHHTGDNKGRNGVLIRGVTRGVEQKDLFKYLKMQKRFKAGVGEDQLLSMRGYEVAGAVDESTLDAISEAEIMDTLREEVLQGAYYLIDYRGYANYEPGDNVVNIFAMGAPTTEAIKASQTLLARGVYANVIVVTSSDLLVGNQGNATDYDYLKNGLGISGDLYFQSELNGEESADMLTIAGRRVPMVSVHDGEPGLLDNLGSVVGVKQIALATYKHSRCGRPTDIFKYHHMDDQSIVEAVGKVLSETALENVRVSRKILEESQQQVTSNQDWSQLWNRSH